MDWDQYFLRITEVVAQKSQDTSRKFGATIVNDDHLLISTGYNGIPKGIAYRPGYHERPDKWEIFVHAEENAIFNAAEVGVSTIHCTMYVLKPPCLRCMRAIVQARIYEVVYKDPHNIEAEAKNTLHPDDWRLSLDNALELASEARLVLRQADLTR